MLTKKNIISSILSLALGFFLVWLLLRFTEVDLEQIIASFYSLNPFYAGLAITALIAHTVLTAFKWGLVTQKLTPDNQQPLKFYLLYTTLGSLTMQFMPQYVGMVIVQNLALRAHKISSFSKGFLSVIYDQFFNLLIPLLLFPTSLLYVLGYISLSVAVFIWIATIILTHFIINKWHRRLISFLIKALTWVKQLKADKKQASQPAIGTGNDSILGKQFTLYLYWISIIRYLVWIIRGILIAIAGGFKIKLWAVAFISPIIQLAMLFSFTPANLGLMEFSWIGLLGLFDVPDASAVKFALMQRFLYIVAVMIILAVFAVVSLVERFGLFPQKQN
ncbi:lysylphosphatidylglycerol synthase transmembrane domain-containing protein [Pleurocapsa sp. PCC 7319]|uniref:lysylphosphatidylglycerol synthase transmembrane domain-containing protein n=1 Tax=Pleurocapsa sp. PCC 7319 TaxID=118161 RepID=UPI0003475173|nr:lysylphosphatidylglycerol synthase transmembrane domain-containing protein [Pleurocapsa sp. PCC 7319]